MIKKSLREWEEENQGGLSARLCVTEVALREEPRRRALQSSPESESES